MRRRRIGIGISDKAGQAGMNSEISCGLIEDYSRGGMREDLNIWIRMKGSIPI